MPLRDRMQAWEVAPSPQSWEKLAAALQSGIAASPDDSHEAASTLRDRMTALEVPPPATAWPAIAAALHAGADPHTAADPVEKTTTDPYPRAKVVPHRSLAPFLYRYAGVAAIVALVVWALNTRLLTGDKQDLSTSIVHLPPAGKHGAATPAGNANPVSPSDAANTANLNSADPAGNSAADPRFLQHGLPRIGATLTAAHGYSLPPVTAMRQLPAVTPDARYFRISNDQGKPVRLSAKFAPLYYQLLSDLETQSGSTRSSFQQMQEFLLSGGFIPDPANLFDVMEFKEVLEDGQ